MRPYTIGNGTVSPRIPREVAALVDALQLEGSNTDALLALDDDDWKKLLDFCDLAHLTLPLSQVKLGGAPSWVIRRLETNVAHNALRYERLKTAYMEAADALDRADVPYLVLKGFTLAPDFVSDPRLRLQSDFDIYCPQPHIEAAQAALQAIGYEPMAGLDYSQSDHVPTLVRPGDWTWKGDWYDPEMPPSVELHFCMWNERVSLIEIPEVARFWDRRMIRRVGHLEFCGLNPVDQLGYFALHIVRWVLCGDWVVHHVYELATFLHRHARDVEFWSQWRDTHSIPLRKLQAVAFTLARNWFSCAVSDLVRAEIDRLPYVQKDWLNRFGGSPLEVMFRRNKDGRLLQLLLTNSRHSRQSVLRKAIIPHVAGPNGRPVRSRYRRDQAVVKTNRFLAYLDYLCSRTVANLAANTSFLFHGISLWLSARALSRQFWLFFAFSFLIWACPSASSSFPDMIWGARP
jgi:hypothetical protein